MEERSMEALLVLSKSENRIKKFAFYQKLEYFQSYHYSFVNVKPFCITIADFNIFRQTNGSWPLSQ